MNQDGGNSLEFQSTMKRQLIILAFTTLCLTNALLIKYNEKKILNQNQKRFRRDA